VKELSNHDLDLELSQSIQCTFLLNLVPVTLLFVFSKNVVAVESTVVMICCVVVSDTEVYSETPMAVDASV